ncbi:MAG: histidinol-phosphate transaminase [Wenzhouxiangellaceae bacterium]|nr:histidinol-phosphate transaminase [Wenzhouxiangellaceae bacterium]
MSDPISAPDLEKLARPEILALQPYASARALAGTAGILLNANESPWPPAGDPGLALNRYPDPQPAALKQRLAELYGTGADNLLLTRGSDEGIDLLLRVFCRAGVDRVLICPPCFGMYALSATVQGASIIEAPLVDRGHFFELAPDFEQRARGCRISFLCSPNNPTGNIIAHETVASLARSQIDLGLVVVDEAYVEFAPETSMMDLLAEHPNLVLLRTLSKAHALAGCRLGCVIAHPSIIGLLRRIIAPYPLPTPTVAIAMQALEPEALAVEREHLQTLATERARLAEALDRHAGIERVWSGAANFVLVRAADGPQLVADAAAAGIRLRDQSAQPGLADCVRITVGAPAENDALIEFMQRWSP